jgi:hypothetical protein
MLYLCIANEEESIVVIDEPQSFLHPAATRELMSILTLYSHVQYVVSSHWPDLLSWPGDHSIIRIESTAQGSTARAFSARDVHELRAAAAELGGGLDCLIGASAVMWVEGPTEEECFAILSATIPGVRPLGFYIVPHGQVSGFNARQRKEVIRVYNNLRTSGLLIPSKSGFLFDSEDLTNHEMTTISGLTTAPIRFLTKPMIESYLLCPAAIAEVINEHLSGCEEFEAVTSDNVAAAVEFAKNDGSTAFERRNDERHAAKILDLVFRNLCGTLLPFRKTLHTPHICRKCLALDWGPALELRNEFTEALTAVLDNR